VSEQTKRRLALIGMFLLATVAMMLMLWGLYR